jgi:hypothetical protein
MNLDESKKKETVRISKKDLLKLLSENEHMAKQVTELQTRMTELVEENRRLKLPPKIAARAEPVYDDPDDEPFPTFDPNPTFDPSIYIDGAYGLKR